jgi:hypothetical protein
MAHRVERALAVLRLAGTSERSLSDPRTMLPGPATRRTGRDGAVGELPAGPDEEIGRSLAPISAALTPEQRDRLTHDLQATSGIPA